MRSHLSPPALSQKLAKHEPLQLVDVRSPGEYASGHIPGAMNMPLEEVAARIDDLDRVSPVVLICESGNRAKLSCETIEPHRGELYVLQGGTSAWIESGLPVVRSTRAGWPLERQVRFAAGLLSLLGLLLGWLVAPGWFGLAAFVAAGLTFSGLSGWCGMGLLMAKMPWNRPPEGHAPATHPTRDTV